MNLHDIADVHTHNRHADGNAIINLPYMAEVPSQGLYSIGMHPWETGDADFDADKLMSKAGSPNVVAIGESGLDALRGAPLDRQEEIFREHVRVSEALSKPLIVHAVRTINRIIELRKQLQPKQPWILHGFRGKPETARQLARAGICISLGEKFNPEVPQAVPREMLFAETDQSAMPIAAIRKRIFGE